MPPHAATHLSQKILTKKSHGQNIKLRQYRKSCYKHWWFKATNLETLKLIDDFQQPPFTFLQYHVDTDSRGRFNVAGFIQTKNKIPRSKMVHHINCKTDVYPTTIVEKQESSFNSRHDLITIGTEKKDVKRSLDRMVYNTLNSVPIHTTVKLIPPSSPDHFADLPVWPISCDKIIASKTIKPFN